MDRKTLSLRAPDRLRRRLAPKSRKKQMSPSLRGVLDLSEAAQSPRYVGATFLAVGTVIRVDGIRNKDVIPAVAGIHSTSVLDRPICWILAFAGMTSRLRFLGVLDLSEATQSPKVFSLTHLPNLGSIFRQQPRPAHGEGHDGDLGVDAERVWHDGAVHDVEVRQVMGAEREIDY
jgi:hypothetical protein